MGKSYVGDIGTRVRMTLDKEDDLTDWTTLEYRVKKPDNTIDTWTPLIVEDLGAGLTVAPIVYYDVVSGDLDQAGQSNIQTYALYTNADTFLSENRKFTVYAPYT